MLYSAGTNTFHPLPAEYNTFPVYINLAYVLGKDMPEVGNFRETLFFNQLAVNHDVVASSKSDFQVNQYTFEFKEEQDTSYLIETDDWVEH